MQYFTVTKIQTTKDGHVILCGKKGMVRIRRVDDSYSGVSYHPGWPEGHSEKDPETHTLELREIPKPKGLFTNVAF